VSNRSDFLNEHSEGRSDQVNVRFVYNNTGMAGNNVANKFCALDLLKSIDYRLGAGPRSENLAQEELIDLASVSVANCQSIKHLAEDSVYFRLVLIRESQNFVNSGTSVHAAFS